MGYEFIKKIKYIFKSLLSIIYYEEEKCAVCGQKTSGFLCSKCCESIKKCSGKNNIIIKNTNVDVYNSTYYSNLIRTMVLKFKYESNFRCGEILSELMLDTINFEKIKYDIITFIPVTKKALIRRGYNQSRILAQNIANKQNKKLKELLIKNKDTKDQIGLNKEQRYANLKGIFGVKNKKDIACKDILLIDDVYTSGATTYYCAYELLRYGAKKVIILTAAKGSIKKA